MFINEGEWSPSHLAHQLSELIWGKHGERCLHIVTSALSMNSWQPLIQYLHVLWQSPISAAAARGGHIATSSQTRWMSQWGIWWYDELQKVFSLTRTSYKSNTPVDVAVVWVSVIIKSNGAKLIPNGMRCYWRIIIQWTPGEMDKYTVF